MAQAEEEVPSGSERQPKPIILWLDANMGDPAEYVHLKKAFTTNSDPRHETWTMITEKDLDASMLSNTAEAVRFEGVDLLLQCFVDPNKCLEAFEKHYETRRVFFIISGSLGRTFVPMLIFKYERHLKDFMGRSRMKFINIFCANKRLHMDWAIKCIEYLEMFDFDQILLQSLVRDIAEYLFERGRRLTNDADLNEAVHYLGDSKKLWLRYQALEAEFRKVDIDKVRANPRLHDVNQLLDAIDCNLRGKDD